LLPPKQQQDLPLLSLLLALSPLSKKAQGRGEKKKGGWKFF
jgi:hypothetical protein